MWQKLKEQIPSILVVTALFAGVAYCWSRAMVTRQKAEMQPIVTQNETLRAQVADASRQLETENSLLREAVSQFRAQQDHSNVEVRKVDDGEMNRLADAIAKRLTPAQGEPASIADLTQSQEKQVDQVASRLSDHLKPFLAGMANDRRGDAAAMAAMEDRLEVTQKYVEQTQAAARDALKLVDEVSALYSDSSRDQGVLVRLLTLPANVVKDSMNMNFVYNGDRLKVQKEVEQKVAEIDRRLALIQGSGVAVAASSGRL